MLLMSTMNELKHVDISIRHDKNSNTSNHLCHNDKHNNDYARAIGTIMIIIAIIVSTRAIVRIILCYTS